MLAAAVTLCALWATPALADGGDGGGAQGGAGGTGFAGDNGDDANSPCPF